MSQNLPAERRPNPAAEFRADFNKMDREIGAALPPHIPVERFMRVVLTAVNGNSDLLKADRKSLFASAMKAAQDGLLPDGRDGALVTYGNQVQWMPMIGGILKKVRNSGELLSIGAHVAYENDRFTYVLGDEEKIEHEPAFANRGKPRLVYAIAKTKDGGIYREVMTVEEVEKVRNVSKAKNAGPWTQWWDEMAKKTVLRRLAKRLPMSSDLDDLIRRDDELYSFDDKASSATATRQVRSFLSDDETPAHNPQTGEILEGEIVGETSGKVRGSTSELAQAEESVGADGTIEKSRDGEVGDVIEDPVSYARERGRKAAKNKLSSKAVPPEYREPGREAEAEAWSEGFAAFKAEQKAESEGSAEAGGNV